MLCKQFVNAWQWPQITCTLEFQCRRRLIPSIYESATIWNTQSPTQFRHHHVKPSSKADAAFSIRLEIRTSQPFNTLRTGEADLRFYITTVQDGWRKCAFLTRACFPCTIHLIMKYIETVSEWSWWGMFIETWPDSELTFRHRASSIQGQAFRYSP